MPNEKELIEKLNHYLQDKGLKRTQQRDIIAQTLFAKPHKHYRIEEILEESRKNDSSISYATVYRTLMMLVDAGLAHQRHFGKGQSQFEVVTDHHHDHLICTKCKKIVEFENDTIEKLQESVAKNHGFKLVHHKMELYGICRECQS